MFGVPTEILKVSKVGPASGLVLAKSLLEDIVVEEEDERFRLLEDHG